ncbi:MAG: eL32 family ribosomal protein, partial [Candidatus Aenigmatarchaeota archaeon]
GYREFLVENSQDLEEVDSKSQAVRISSNVGKRKRIDILEKADEEGIKVLNARRHEIGSRDAEETGS